MLHSQEKAGNLLPMTVTEGVTVNVLPYEQYEYLMTTKEVAKGYGISEYTLRRHKMQHPLELTEGKHFVTAVQILNGKSTIPRNATLWTKRGIIRLGFFIKSKQAILFRDWAEELIIKVDEQRNLFGEVAQTRALPKKRKHNRLTQARMVDILADVCKIEDKELRMSITNKLMGKEVK